VTEINQFRSTIGVSASAAKESDAVDGVQPQVVVEPNTAEEVSRVVRYANEKGLRVAVRGGGTKLSWGNAPSGVDVLLSLARMNRVVEHAWADMTATVEAGCTVRNLQDALAEHGQRLALDALFPERATIGGILATNDSGALRVRFGSLRDLIIGVKIVLADGTIARSGGKVVKNVAGYDLQKLMTGAFGTLGVIAEATFRLYPLPKETRTVSFALSSIEEANALALAIHDSILTPTGIQMRFDSEGQTPEMDVRFEGVSAAIEAQGAKLLSLAQSARQIESSNDVWLARENLWRGVYETKGAKQVNDEKQTIDETRTNDEKRMICKLSVSPAQIAEACRIVSNAAASKQISWRIVAQSVGLIAARFDAKDEASLFQLIEGLRAHLRQINGSCVVLEAPRALKSKIDVWGDSGDATELMRRVKAQFDPKRTLNAGRFVGGI
jgi:glycolate oxidase FAD binding subunit